MDRFERIRETGEWWVDPWWESPDCNIHFPCSKEELRAATEVLRQHFNASWTKSLLKNPRANFILPLLCIERSTSALGLIATFGKVLQDLRSSVGLTQKISDLKLDKADSAFFEIEAAHAFHQAGYQINFPQEGGTKKPDILASTDTTTVAIECKRLRDEVWESWESEIMHELAPITVAPNDGPEITTQISMNPRLTDILIGTDDALNKAFKDAITKLFIEGIQVAIKANQFPLVVRIGEFGSITIDIKKDGIYSSINGVERGTPSIFRRILQNGFLRAKEQLPEDCPGLIVIYSKQTPDQHFFNVLFEAACASDKEKYSHIVGVMLCPMQTILTRRSPIFFRNQHTRHREQTEQIAHVLKQGFGAMGV